MVSVLALLNLRNRVLCKVHLRYLLFFSTVDYSFDVLFTYLARKELFVIHNIRLNSTLIKL
jgi:hypothetical protein